MEKFLKIHLPRLSDNNIKKAQLSVTQKSGLHNGYSWRNGRFYCQENDDIEETDAKQVKNEAYTKNDSILDVIEPDQLKQEVTALSSVKIIDELSGSANDEELVSSVDQTCNNESDNILQLLPNEPIFSDLMAENHHPVIEQKAKTRINKMDFSQNIAGKISNETKIIQEDIRKHTTQRKRKRKQQKDKDTSQENIETEKKKIKSKPPKRKMKISKNSTDQPVEATRFKRETARKTEIDNDELDVEIAVISEIKQKIKG